MKNNPNLILVILLLTVIACNCPKSENSRTSQIYPLTNTGSSQTPQTLFSNSPVPLKPNSAESASVITENATLRQSPNGTVLQTLPIAASVEVIRQKGAWFYVSYGTVKGWMHGNSIRYDSPNNSLTETSSTPKNDSKTSTDKEYKPSTIEKSDSSGATAKCRDGTLNFSAHRRGTCSHHGGVAVWY